jgi:hypothetical protein
MRLSPKGLGVLVEIGVAEAIFVGDGGSVSAIVAVAAWVRVEEGEGVLAGVNGDVASSVWWEVGAGV